MPSTFKRPINLTVDVWSPEDAVPERVKKLLVPSSTNQINYALAFIQIIRLLKTQKRTGWIDREIPLDQVESIADHMYRMSIISMLIPNSDHKINIDRCVKIAAVHDIAESLVGDITPFEGVSKKEKNRREYATIKYLSQLIKPYNEQFSDELENLWLDYEEIRTIEARYVKDIDKLEMIQQAWDYEQDHGIKYNLDEFYLARAAIKTPEVGALCDEIVSQRTEFVKHARNQ